MLHCDRKICLILIFKLVIQEKIVLLFNTLVWKMKVNAKSFYMKKVVLEPRSRTS